MKVNDTSSCGGKFLIFYPEEIIGSGLPLKENRFMTKYISTSVADVTVFKDGTVLDLIQEAVSVEIKGDKLLIENVTINQNLLSYSVNDSLSLKIIGDLCSQGGESYDKNFIISYGSVSFEGIVNAKFKNSEVNTVTYSFKLNSQPTYKFEKYIEI